MKRNRFILILMALTLALLLILPSCSEDTSDEPIYYTVTFNSNGGTKIEPKKAESGKTVGKPANPEKEGFIFDGWYFEGREWSFEFNQVKQDMTLEARWLSPENVFEHQPTGDGQTTTITKVKNKTADLIVPTAMGGYTVVAIADGVFRDLSDEDVYSVVLPETVTVVGDECFMNSDNISIVVKGELLAIGEKAFYGCNGLKNISLGEGMENVTAEAFVGCTSLKTVRIPKSVKNIEENAFDSCTGLQSVMIYSDLNMVENMAFCDSGLKVIYLYGSEKDADELMDSKVDAGNDEFLDATILRYSAEEPTEDTEYGGFWYLDENDQVRKWS